MIRSFTRSPAGDKILFVANNEGEIVVTKDPLLDEGYLVAVEASLAEEWNSPEDEEAFGNI